MKVRDTGQGRIIGGAVEQSEADKQFGGVEQKPIDLARVPTEAFGDSRGELAIANSISNIGDTVMNIAIREKRLQQAEDDAAYKRIKTDYGIRENEVRADIERRSREEGWDPDTKLEYYQSEMKKVRADLFGVHQFKTISDETLVKDLRQWDDHYTIRYKAGTIEQNRVENVKNQNRITLDNYINSAHEAGQNRDINKLGAIIQQIREHTSSQAYIYTHGGTQAQTLQTNAITRSVIGWVQNVARNNPSDALRLIEDKNSPLSKFLSDNQRMDLMDDVTRIIHNESIKTENEQNKYLADLQGNMSLRLVQGNLTRTDIMNSPLKDGQKAHMLSMLEAKTKAAAKAQESYNIVQNVIDSGGTMYGEKGRSQKMVDEWYAQHLLINKDVPDQSKSLKQVQYAQLVKNISQIGIIPTQLSRQLNGLINSPDPNRVEEGMTIIRNIKQLNYRMSSEFSEETNALSHMTDRKYTISEAKQLIQRSSQMTKVEVGLWNKKADDYFSTDKNKVNTNVESKIRDLMGEKFNWDYFTEGGTIPPQAVADYKDTFRRNLILTQDQERAKKLTDEKFLQHWSRTKIDGFDRMTKHAPEAYYGSTTEPSKNKWMTEQLEYDLAKFKLKRGEYVLQVQEDSIVAGKKPLYVVYDVRHGKQEILRDPNTNKIILWAPNKDDWNKIMQAKEYKKRQSDIQFRREMETQMKTGTSLNLSGSGVPTMLNTIRQLRNQPLIPESEE